MLAPGYYNMDCMAGMREFPDKHFDLAIVDPPYGINEPLRGLARDFSVTQKNGKTLYAKPNYLLQDKKWDSKRPTIEYFNELKRISKNQIIFGGNYFADLLNPSMGWIVWDKLTTGSFSDCELLYSSFWQANRIFKYLWNGMQQGESIGAENQFGDKKKNEKRIHPCQKPVKVYRWLLKNYASPGDLILDTHVGSASSLIAFEQMGFQYVGFELDVEYYRDSTARLEKARELLRQGDIFAPEKTNGKAMDILKQAALEI